MFENLTSGLKNVGGSFTDMIKENPEQFAITADMIGKNLAPENPFAGVGTAWGKSSLATQEEEKAQAEAKSSSMFENIIKRITGGDKDGISNISVSMDPVTGMLKWKVDGLGEGSTPGERLKKLPLPEGSQAAGSALDLLNTLGQ